MRLLAAGLLGVGLLAVEMLDAWLLIVGLLAMVGLVGLVTRAVWNQFASFRRRRERRQSLTAPKDSSHLMREQMLEHLCSSPDPRVLLRCHRGPHRLHQHFLWPLAYHPHARGLCLLGWFSPHHLFVGGNSPAQTLKLLLLLPALLHLGLPLRAFLHLPPSQSDGTT